MLTKLKNIKNIKMFYSLFIFKSNFIILLNYFF